MFRLLFLFLESARVTVHDSQFRITLIYITNTRFETRFKDDAFVSHYKEPEENNNTTNKLNLLFTRCTVFYFVFTWEGGGFHWLGRKWPRCSKATCPDDDTGSTFPAPVRSHPGNRKPFPCWHKPWDSKCFIFFFFFFFCTLFLSSNSLFILFFKLIVSPTACLPLSDTPQALKALQDMSLTSPCSPPPLHSMRHSKSIPVQAFEVCTDIHQTCTPT